MPLPNELNAGVESRPLPIQNQERQVHLWKRRPEKKRPPVLSGEPALHRFAGHVQDPGNRRMLAHQALQVMVRML